MTPAEVHAAIGVSIAEAIGVPVAVDAVDVFVVGLTAHGLVLTTRESYDEGVRAIRTLEEFRRDAVRLKHEMDKS